MILARVIRHPGRAFAFALALARGWWYKMYYPLRGIRFSAGRRFLVEGRLSIRGPGTVRFGDRVQVAMTVTPWTYAPDAVIDIGSGTFLNGTRFGCARSIVVGPECILADAQIFDTNFHSTHANRHDLSSPIHVAPVELARNVWIAARVGLLPGTQIGENSVVGFGAVCAGKFPANMIVAGNPAAVVRPVPGAPEIP